MVNYYREMWPLRSHLLASLSSLTSAKVKWKWTTDYQEAFDKMKALIAKETLHTFPDFSQEFEVQTDASKLQLGACISQNGKPVAFYSIKLQSAQTRYLTTESPFTVHGQGFRTSSKEIGCAGRCDVLFCQPAHPILGLRLHWQRKNDPLLWPA
jgi:hypothetical protein